MKLGRAFVVDDAALIDCNVAESEAQWLVGTTYAANAVVRQTVDGVHRRFHSAVNSNLGNDPALLDATKWVDEGPTNRWAMLDNRLQLQTSNSDSVYLKIQLTGRIDTLYAGNIRGQEMRVVCTDAGAVVRYDRTVNLVSTSRITSWARWYREPIRLLNDKGLTDLPSGFTDLVLEVTISDPGETVLVGEIVPAFMAEIGGTQWGGRLGNKSYSRIAEDDFGEDFITRRGRKRQGGFGVIVDNRDLDDVTTLLDDCDGRAVLYIADDRYNSMFLFGLLNTWSELVTWPTRTALSMDIQSFVRGGA